MLSYGFDACIKANSPLVNRLMSDTLLEWMLNHASIKRRFNNNKSDKLVLGFRFYKEHQTGR